MQMRSRWTIYFLVLALFAPVMMFGGILVRFIGQCVGGLGTGSQCEHIPNNIGDLMAPIVFLGWAGLFTWMPFWLVAALVAESVKRRQKRHSNQQPWDRPLDRDRDTYWPLQPTTP